MCQIVPELSRREFKDTRRWPVQVIALAALLASYFYCLPLVSAPSVAGISSEVRIYDIVFALILAILIRFRVFDFLFYWNKLSRAHHWLLIFVGLAAVSLLFTAFFEGWQRMLIGWVRWYRLFSYSAAFALVFLWVRQRFQLVRLLDVFLVCTAAVATISVLQGFGYVGNLWPESYAVYWQHTAPPPVATLAPNHSHISMVMAIGIAMVLARMQLTGTSLSTKVLLAFGALPMGYAMIASGGRSGWLAFGVYFVLSLLICRAKLQTAVAGMLFVAVFAATPASQRQMLGDVLRYRTVVSLPGAERDVSILFSDADASLLERVDSDRHQLYAAILNRLSERPMMVAFGTGYQNALYGLNGIAVAAHNGYLNVLIELGIPGLLVYLAWLLGMIRLGIRRMPMSNGVDASHLARHWLAIAVGILAANMFADAIYAQRALFTFLGIFLFVSAICLNPAWVRRGAMPARRRTAMDPETIPT